MKEFMTAAKSILSSHDRGPVTVWAQMREYYRDGTMLIYLK
jgi:hypothetical protein